MRIHDATWNFLKAGAVVHQKDRYYGYLIKLAAPWVDDCFAVGLASGLRAAAEVRASLPADAETSLLSVSRLVQRLADNDDVIQLIESALVNQPPLSASEGVIIRAGYSTELDQVKEASQNGQKWITEMEQRERKRTGIASLKVGYTKVFGY